MNSAGKARAAQEDAAVQAFLSAQEAGRQAQSRAGMPSRQKRAINELGSGRQNRQPAVYKQSCSGSGDPALMPDLEPFWIGFTQQLTMAVPEPAIEHARVRARIELTRSAAPYDGNVSHRAVTSRSPAPTRAAAGRPVQARPR